MTKWMGSVRIDILIGECDWEEKWDEENGDHAGQHGCVGRSTGSVDFCRSERWACWSTALFYYL